MDKTYLPLCKRRARRRHHILHPALVHGYHVHVSFHKNTLVFLNYGLLGLIEAVKLVTLLIDLRFGRIHVLCHILVLTQSAATERNHLSRDGEHRENHAASETVLHRTALGLVAKARLQKEFFGETLFEGGIIEVITLFERIAQMEALYHGIVDAAFTEIAQADILSRLCFEHTLLEMLHGKIIDGKHTLALTCLLAFLVGQLMLLNLYMVFIGKITESLIEAHLLQLHNEIDRASALTAAETLAYTLRLRDTKRRRAFIMERTQAYIAAASALQVHKVTHNLHNVSCIKNLLNRCLINTSHSTKLQKKPAIPIIPIISITPIIPIIPIIPIPSPAPAGLKPEEPRLPCGCRGSV